MASHARLHEREPTSALDLEACVVGDRPEGPRAPLGRAMEGPDSVAELLQDAGRLPGQACVVGDRHKRSSATESRDSEDPDSVAELLQEELRQCERKGPSQQCQQKGASENLSRALEDELRKLQRDLCDGHARACALVASRLRGPGAFAVDEGPVSVELHRTVSQLREENRQLKEQLSSRLHRDPKGSKAQVGKPSEGKAPDGKVGDVKPPECPLLGGWAVGVKRAGSEAVRPLRPGAAELNEGSRGSSRAPSSKGSSAGGRRKSGSESISRSSSKSSSSSAGAVRKSEGEEGTASKPSAASAEKAGSSARSSGDSRGKKGKKLVLHGREVDASLAGTVDEAARRFMFAGAHAAAHGGHMSRRNSSRRPSLSPMALNQVLNASRRASNASHFAMLLPGAPTPGDDAMTRKPSNASNFGALERHRRRSFSTSALADMGQQLDFHPQLLEAINHRKDSTTHIYCDTFHVLEVWEGEILPVRPLNHNRTQERLRTLSTADLGDSPSRARILKPNGTIRASWDTLSLLLVMIDVITIPLTFFDISQGALMVLLAWVARLFWTFDIGTSFFTGYIGPDGGVVLRQRKIALRYLRTWLFLDIALVSIDWLSCVSGLDGSQQASQLGRTARVMRILRMTRLVRLVRMQKVIGLLSERIRSEKLVLIADIAKIVIMVLGFAHILACILYGLGRDNDDGWVHQASFNYGDNIGRWYALSFHWSLAQFSGLGFDEIRVYNMKERVFSIIVTFLAFAVASAVVSSLTSTLTRLHILASAVEKQVNTLRRYLTENCITTDLSLRIQRNAQHRMREQQHFLDESNVKLLELVSEALRAEMHFELYSPILSEHPFLRRYCEMHREVMTRVCHSAVSRKILSQGDVVFNKGELPSEPHMLFVESGLLEYEREESLPPEEVGKKRWIAEANLWTVWMHRGKLQAKTDCRLLVLDSRTFQDKVSQFFTSEVNPRAYAKTFVEGLNEMEQGELSDLTVIHTFLEEDGTGSTNWTVLRPLSLRGNAHDDHGRASKASSSSRGFMRSFTAGL